MSYETDGPYFPRELREQTDAIREAWPSRLRHGARSRISRPNLIAY